MIHQRNTSYQPVRSFVAKYVGKHSLLWRRTVILLSSWLLFFALLVYYPADHCQVAHVEEVCNGPFHSESPANRIGCFAYVGLDAEKDYRPLHSIRFNELGAESGQFGLFKTGVYRTVWMTGLHLRLYSYLADSDIQSRNNDHPDIQNTNHKDVIESRNNGHPDIQNTNHKDILAILQALIHKNTVSLRGDLTECSTSANAIIHIGNINLNNIGEMKIREFGYEFFANGDKIVSIRSSFAHISYAMEDIVLRGHVTISSGDGDMLEGNHVYWNNQTERFSVKGNYVLTRGGDKFFGKDVIVDMDLNEIYSQQAHLDKTEEGKWLRM